MGGNTLIDKYPDINCPTCGKLTPDDEYVVNWGSCNECFDKHYQEYLESVEKT